MNAEQACDGIWDVASDQEVCCRFCSDVCVSMFYFLSQAVDCVRKAGGDAKAQSAALIKFVIEKGTKDNLTAMISKKEKKKISQPKINFFSIFFFHLTSSISPIEINRKKLSK